MSKTITFRQHAIEVHKSTAQYFLCNNLDEDQAAFVEKYFLPTVSEIIEYGMSWYAWLSANDITPFENNEFRIMVLLFAEQLWEDGNR